MTTPAELHRREVARLSRILANPSVTAFEREAAQAALDRLTKPAACQWCLDTIASHRGAKCPVIVRFQARNGRGVLPAEQQAADIRARIAEEAGAKERAERKKESKGRQGKLFG